MTSFEAFEKFLKEATTPGPGRILPGVVVAAVDRTGVTYSHAAGTQSVDPDSPLINKPFSMDTTMWMASCTKLLTSLAALQCVERGLLTVDGDICKIPGLEGLGQMKILKGFKEDGETPILEGRQTPVTLRHLLSHSSGLAYNGFDPDIVKVTSYNQKGKPPIPADRGLTGENYFEEIWNGALKFEPGTGWTYGVGIDVAGLAVEKVTGLSLEEYFEKEFFEPYKMTSTSFNLDSKPTIRAERADMAVRAQINDVSMIVPSPTRVIADKVDVNMGGAGLWSCARDYTQILQRLLQDPCPLFQNQETLEYAFQPCLTPLSKRAMQDILSSEGGKLLTGGSLPAGIEVDYTMAGLCTPKGVDGSRGGAGDAISWGGLPNLLWCVDRKKGKAVFYGSQLLPLADPKSGDTFSKFEAIVFGGDAPNL